MSKYKVEEKNTRNSDIQIMLHSSRFLGSRAVAVLNHWFQLNRDYPYPDDERTEQLANEAGNEQ